MTTAPAASHGGHAAPHANDKAARTRWLEFNTGHEEPAFKGNRTRTSKYTALTYFPKALYEQYRRIANIYFTTVAAVSVTKISPLNPITTFLPLVLVIGVSLIKEAFEDVKRHKADNVENNRLTEVYDPGAQEFVPRKWCDVKVGDVVRVVKDQPFCADLLLISAYNEDGVSYVETMNLDGETNLKLRKALDETQHFTDEDLATFKGAIECEKPNASLYTFTGNMHATLGGAELTIPLTPQAIMLRGSSLRNTHRILGVVIFAGHDTKVFMNARAPPSKRSTIEKGIDRIIYFMFALLFTICFIGGTWNGILTRDKMKHMWYLEPEHTQTQYDPNKPVLVGLIAFVTSFVLYGYLIPISLYVSIEIVKLAQVYFIMRDRAMYHDETGQFALARTSNLNEELGMVQCVLSDKTGTLTRNEMEFFKCAINGISYGRGVTEIERAVARRTGKKLNLDDDLPVPEEYRAKGFNFFDDRLMDNEWSRGDQKQHVYEFLRCLAVCHTVIPEGDSEVIKATHEVKYEAESPDEAALLMAAKQLGLMFFKRSTDTIGVLEMIDGVEHERTYEILNILEFNSTRKRMSVIFRDQEGRIMMYTKGADTVIYERLAKNNDDKVLAQTRALLEHYGDAGLRTLCLSFCELDPTKYDAWNEKFIEARTAIEHREKRLMDVFELIEKDLILLGCTAIEDKLQEGVPETITMLLEAGIRVWMLTGDKLETAVNIGFACALLDNNMTQHLVSSETPDVVAAEAARNTELALELAEKAVRRQLDEAWAKIVGQDASTAQTRAKPSFGSRLRGVLSRIVRGARDEVAEPGDAPHALIIDGKALAFALKTQENKELVWKIGSRCASVICCRVSPMQKAQVTALVKGKGLRTLGIGDGANDVGMIQEADIGVGISGLEGRQAVMASDFAIGQFRFLQSLVLVHGRWCYKRIARMVNFFFYKNIVFGMTLFYFNGCSFFSGGLTYDEFYISLYNVIFTSVTPLAIGIFDQDVPRKVSIKYPGLYRQGPRNEYFDLRARCWWFVNGFYQSAVTFVGVLYANRLVAGGPNGFLIDNWQNGIVMFTVVIITVHSQVAVILDHWNWLHHVAIWGSQLLWFVFLLAYGNLPSFAIFNYNIRFMWETMIANQVHYWLVIICVPVLNLLPHFLITMALRKMAPGDHVIVQEYLALHDRGMLKDDEEQNEAVMHPRDFYLSVGGTASRKQSAFVGDALAVDRNNPVIKSMTSRISNDPRKHLQPFPSNGGMTVELPPAGAALGTQPSGLLSPGDGGRSPHHPTPSPAHGHGLGPSAGVTFQALAQGEIRGNGGAAAESTYLGPGALRTSDGGPVADAPAAAPPIAGVYAPTARGDPGASTGQSAYAAGSPPGIAVAGRASVGSLVGPPGRVTSGPARASVPVGQMSPTAWANAQPATGITPEHSMNDVRVESSGAVAMSRFAASITGDRAVPPVSAAYIGPGSAGAPRADGRGYRGAASLANGLGLSTQSSMSGDSSPVGSTGSNPFKKAKSIRQQVNETQPF